MSYEIYKIEKLEDFLNVPEDRLDICLTEFRDFLEFLRFNQVTEAQGVKMLPVFNWCDDGERGLSKLRFYVENMKTER